MNEIKDIFEKLKTERMMYEPDWEIILTLLFPDLLPIVGWEGTGNTNYKVEGVFDNGPAQALERFSSLLMKSIVPEGYYYHQLKIYNEDGTVNKTGTNKADSINETLFGYRYGAASNFSPTINSCFNGYGSVGNGFMFIDWEDGLNYKFIPIQQCWFDTDYKGKLDTFIYKFKMKISDVREEFGFVPESLAKKKDYEMVSIYNAIYKNSNYKKGSVERKELRFTSKYFITEDFIDLNKEEGYSKMPYIPFMAPPKFNEKYGCGTAWSLLGDIWTANEYGKLFLNAAQFQLNPVWGSSDTVSVESITPGGFMEGSISPEGKFLVQPVPLESGGELSELDYQRRLKRINDGFLVGLMNTSQGNQEKTKAEVDNNASELASQMTPISSIIQSKSLPLMIERELDLLVQNGIIEEDDIEDIVIEFDAPSNRMREQERLNGFYRVAESLPLVSQIDPVIPMMFSGKDIAELMTYANNLPSKILISYEDAKKKYDEAVELAKQKETSEINKNNSDANQKNAKAEELRSNGSQG